MISSHKDVVNIDIYGKHSSAYACLHAYSYSWSAGIVSPAHVYIL